MMGDEASRKSGRPRRGRVARHHRGGSRDAEGADSVGGVRLADAARTTVRRSEVQTAAGDRSVHRRLLLSRAAPRARDRRLRARRAIADCSRRGAFNLPPRSRHHRTAYPRRRPVLRSATRSAEPLHRIDAPFPLGKGQASTPTRIDGDWSAWETHPQEIAVKQRVTGRRSNRIRGLGSEERRRLRATPPPPALAPAGPSYARAPRSRPRRRAARPSSSARASARCSTPRRRAAAR